MLIKDFNRKLFKKEIKVDFRELSNYKENEITIDYE